MTILYDFLMAVYFLLMLPILWIRGRGHRLMIQRLGLYPQPTKGGGQTKPVWFHAVSVGEVFVAEAVARRLKERHPHVALCLTTVTATGYRVARDRFQGMAEVYFAPLDVSFCVRRALDRFHPALYVMTETEIWPAMLNEIHRRGIPAVLINGRISSASFQRYQKIGRLIRPLMERGDLFLMQTPLDAERIQAMGAVPERVLVTGNVKFDCPIPPERFGRSSLGVSENGFVLIAGSTHPGEEDWVLEMVCRLRKRFPVLRLILAPRHVERSAEIVSKVSCRGFKARRFSERPWTDWPEDTVLIVDTMGDLASLYHDADGVIVGKSFLGRGGQNVIEPALCGRPIVVGPHMENFEAVVSLFKTDKALVQVDSDTACESVIRQWLEDRSAARDLGQRARATALTHRGACDRILQALELRWPSLFPPEGG